MSRSPVVAERTCVICGELFRANTNANACSDVCKKLRRAQCSDLKYAIFKQSKKPGDTWGPTRAVTGTQVHHLQIKRACEICEREFWHYHPPRKDRKPARCCSLECAKKLRAIASGRWRGRARVERTDPQQCTTCAQWFPLAKFYITKSSGLPMRRCPDCVQASGLDAVGKRRAHLRQKFKMTLEDWAEMHRSQNGACAICETLLPPVEAAFQSQPRGTSWADRNWNTDHCHHTGKVRGILCRACNQALGSLRDTPAIARACALYLEKHRVCEHVLCAFGPAGKCQE